MPACTVWLLLGHLKVHRANSSLWLRRWPVQMQGVTGRHLGFSSHRGGAPPHPEANSRPGLLTNDHEEDSNDHLQKQRDADEGDEGGVVMTGRPLLQHRFQLRGVRHKEGHVQYALCHALLRGIVVQVDGWAPPGAGVPRL